MNFRFSESEIENQESKMRGVSLIEVLIVLSMVGMLIVAISPHLRSGRQVWEVVGDRHADVVQNARIGMDKMVREIRQAQGLNVADSSYIEFVDKDSNDMKFQLNAQYLECGPPDSLAVLAGPANNLSFTYYEEDAVTTTTSLGDVRSVLIQLTTLDSEGKVDSVALSSRVFIRKSFDIVSDHPILDMAVFGLKKLKMENDAVITGDVGSSKKIELKNDSVVNGDATVEDADDIDIKNNAVLNGDVIIDSVSFPSASSFSAGSTNMKLKNSDQVTLSPGSYRDLEVRDNGILTLQAGDYYFKKIHICGNAIIDFPSSGSVRFFVTGHVHLHKDPRIAIGGTVVDIGSETAKEKAKDIYTETRNKFEMKDTSQWIGMVFASNTTSSKESKLENSAKLTGNLYSGHKIKVKGDATVDFVAPNSDILPSQFLE